MTTTTPTDIQFALDILAHAEANGHHVTTVMNSGSETPFESPTPFRLDDLIAEASGKLGVTPSVTDEVEAVDADAITELWTRAEELKKIADRAEKDRAKITALLKQATPEGKTLTVHGAPVFANTIVVTRSLDQKAVKNEFPDIPGNERFYTETISTRALYKR